MNSDLKSFLEMCLHVDPRKRSMPEELLRHKLFDGLSETPSSTILEYLFYH